MESAGMTNVLKIKRILDKLRDSKCHNKTDDHEAFFKLISQQKNPEIAKRLISLPIFTEWITHAVGAWLANRVTPPPSVSTFTLNLASLLLNNEEKFCFLNSNNFFIKLANVTQARKVDVDVCVKLAYVKLLSAFFQHQSGVEWMTACSFWEDVFQLSLRSQNGVVIRECTVFMSKLLEETVEHDDGFCDNVIKRILLPLGENVYKTIKESNTVEEVIDEVSSQKVKPVVTLIGSILEYFMEGVLSNHQRSFRVLFLFLKNIHLEERVSDLMLIATKRCLVFDLSKIVYIIQFVELFANFKSKKVSLSQANTVLHKIIDTTVVNVSKMDYETALKSARFGQLYWKVIQSKISCVQACRNGEVERFADQLGLLTSVCAHCASLKYCFPMKAGEMSYDVIRDHDMQTILKLIRPDLFRTFFRMRDDLLLQTNFFDTFYDTLTHICETRKFYRRKCAVMIFLGILYFIKDTVLACKLYPEKFETFNEQVRVMSFVVQVVGMLIEEFQITWKDTFECINVLELLFEFLSLSTWNARIVAGVLDLVNICVVRHMSANLALLVDRTSDSTMALLGPLLYMKSQDRVPEVRRGALDVMRTLTCMSCGKFPSLQKVLMDSELPTLVVKMSTCDGESFVRATAIKCLTEMIQVEEIWDNALISQNLSDKMRHILLNETEGIVRVEAATFMCVTYDQHQFLKDTLDSVYETMIHSSTTDLHWEVKVRALDFWNKVIKNYLQNQGMIDGSFPNVTFSKEHRKIVTLTDAEIRKRLQKVLGQLSTIGCLGVLMSAIKDDCDMEVSKTAVKITQQLVDLFKKYKIYGDSSFPTSPLPTENGLSSEHSVSSGVSLDDAMDSPASYHFNEEVIEQIVNAKDVSLLKNVYSPSDYGSVNNYDIQVRKVVTPNEFLLFTQQDLDHIITEKKNWLNGIEDLGSLLDDMLKNYDDDVNNMDCY